MGGGEEMGGEEMCPQQQCYRSQGYQSRQVWFRPTVSLAMWVLAMSSGNSADECKFWVASRFMYGEYLSVIHVPNKPSLWSNYNILRSCISTLGFPDPNGRPDSECRRTHFQVGSSNVCQPSPTKCLRTIARTEQPGASNRRRLWGQHSASR